MDRRELEQLWRGRVAEAERRFKAARDRTNAVVRDFPVDGISPDGRYAYEQAVRHENAALAEYRRVVQVYTDLVTRGIVPGEDEGPPH